MSPGKNSQALRAHRPIRRATRKSTASLRPIRAWSPQPRCRDGSMRPKRPDGVGHLSNAIALWPLPMTSFGGMLLPYWSNPRNHSEWQRHPGYQAGARGETGTWRSLSAAGKQLCRRRRVDRSVRVRARRPALGAPVGCGAEIVSATHAFPPGASPTGDDFPAESANPGSEPDQGVDRRHGRGDENRHAEVPLGTSVAPAHASPFEPQECPMRMHRITPCPKSPRDVIAVAARIAADLRASGAKGPAIESPRMGLPEFRDHQEKPDRDQ